MITRLTPQSRKVSMAAQAVAPVAMMGSRRIVMSDGAVDAEAGSVRGVSDGVDGAAEVVEVVCGEVR